MMDRRSLLHGLSGLAIAPAIAAGQPAAAREAAGYLHPNTLAGATYAYMAPVWRAQGFPEPRPAGGKSMQLPLRRASRHRVPSQPRATMRFGSSNGDARDTRAGRVR